ncbi:MAG: hypothetical protein ACPGXK_08905 [Phycisphaerae bacterium]
MSRFCRSLRSVSWWSCAVVFLAAAAACAETIHVSQSRCAGTGAGTESDPFCTIQAAIDGASSLDTILVEPGVYHETPALTAKSLTVRSTGGAAVTTISGEGLPGTVVTITNIPPPFYVLDGFTITGGSNDSGVVLGGGLLIFHSFGGEVRNCIFRGNSALRGGGFFNFGSEPLFTNCAFLSNHADDSGGGIYNDHGVADFTNCTVVGNTANVEAGGIFIAFTPTIANSIFWGNSDSACGVEAAQVLVAGSWKPTITHCLVEGLDSLSGAGNIGADPMFLDAVGGDLRTMAGSPAHDAGDNSYVLLAGDIAGQPRLADDPMAADTGLGSGALVDLGVHEFHVPLAAAGGGDCNGNGVPDAEESDCNANAVPDDCDIDAGYSVDSDENGVPDECEAPLVAVLGPRYVQILPAVVDEPVALHVASPDFPCLDHYVTLDGGLVSEPVFQMPHEWHALGIRVTSGAIVPAATYSFASERESGEFSPSRSVTMWASGDVDHNGAATFLDVLLVVQGVSGNFCNVSFEAIDLDGCEPNGVINIADALRAVHAFQQQPYGTFCPLPCE